MLIHTFPFSIDSSSPTRLIFFCSWITLEGERRDGSHIKHAQKCYPVFVWKVCCSCFLQEEGVWDLPWLCHVECSAACLFQWMHNTHPLGQISKSVPFQYVIWTGCMHKLSFGGVFMQTTSIQNVSLWRESIFQRKESCLHSSFSFWQNPL